MTVDWHPCLLKQRSNVLVKVMIGLFFKHRPQATEELSKGRKLKYLTTRTTVAKVKRLTSEQEVSAVM